MIDPDAEVAAALKAAAALRNADSGRFRLNAVTILVMTALLVTLALFVPTVTQPWKDTAELVLVAGLSGLVGYGELVSRYRDNPIRLFAAPLVPAYLLVNIAGGIGALVLVRATHALGDNPRRVNETMLAGFGAIAFFRTSLFTVRIGGSDLGIGPSALLKSLLDAADRAIDRAQAEGRAVDVARLMATVDFAKAVKALPLLCFTLVQNLTPDDQKGAGEQITALAEAPGVSDEARSIILGVYLIRLVGADVLEQAVKALGDHLRADAPFASPSPIVPPAPP